MDSLYRLGLLASHDPMNDDAVKSPEPRESQGDSHGSIERLGPELDVTSAAPPVARVDPYVGRTIDGRYLLERVLGEGGMGVVYAGRHKVIDKRVAVKVLRNDMARDQEMTERFLQEARAASSIGNPHIIDISDFGTLPDGSTYFVMEYLDGQSLSDLVAALTVVPETRLVNIAKQLALALSSAHGAGIVHRDLKPDNVMLVSRGADTDFVKILDFGIAKVGATSKITRAGSVFGTPHYMAPEQGAGAQVDARTDVYALGVILYEMATGKVPFDADNFMAILTQHMYKPPSPLRAIHPSAGVSDGLEAIVLKCLMKRPEARYESMRALYDDLCRLERGEIPLAQQEPEYASGAHAVPEDYFRASGVPASRRSRADSSAASASSSPRRGALVGSVTALLGIVVAVVLFMRKTPSPSEKTVPSERPTPETIDSARADHAGVERETQLVLVGADPPDAKIARDGRDLGGAPVALRLLPDEQATLTVTRDGYKPLTVTVDSSQPKRVLRLTSLPPPAATGRTKPNAVSPSAHPHSVPSGTSSTTPSHAPPPAHPPAFPSSELTDPWKK